MAGNKQTELLMQIVAGQAKMDQQITDMHARLFGGNGQPGALKFMYDKHEEHTKAITECNTKITVDLQEFKKVEVEPLVDKLATLEAASTVTTWKIGALSGIGGTGIAVAVEMFLKKFFHGA